MQEFDSKSGKKSLKDFKLDIAFMSFKDHFELLLNRSKYRSGTENTFQEAIAVVGARGHGGLGGRGNNTDEEK